MATVLKASLTGVDVTEAWGWKPAADEFVPDVMITPPNEEDVRFTDMPLLVVEVLSGNRDADLVRRSTKYAALGLGDYWVVDPHEHTVHTFRLAGRAYESTGVFDSGLCTLGFAEHRVEVDVDALLA